MQEDESIEKNTEKDSSTKIDSIFHLISQFTRKSYKGSEHPSKRWGQSAVLNNKSMVIFGGRHSQRCLSNIYSLSFQTLYWSKIEQIGISPPARDSHSAIMYNGDMFIFGGSGSENRLNDLWSFNFSDKRWSKINSQGDIPCARDGHLTGLIYQKYMMVYGGLDSSEEVISTIHLLNLKSLTWITPPIEGDEPGQRDSQSCALIDNKCYLFGGQDKKDTLYNDMYVMSFDLNEQENKYKVILTKEKTIGELPPCRSSHTCVSYSDRYIFIIGGEGEQAKPRNDIWMYDTQTKAYTEIKIENNNTVESRFCHSSILYGDVVAIYGGMQNAEHTLDSLVLLSYENKNEPKPTSSSLDNKSNNNANETKMEIEPNKPQPSLTQPLIPIQPPVKQSTVEEIEIGTDTSDLCDQKAMSFEEIKKNYINNLISWTFLKKLSDFNQWPIGCIGNFINNSLKDSVNAKNIFIDAKFFSETGEIVSKESIKNNSFKASNSKILLSIIDDGKGLSCIEFNQVMYSFAQNENKEYNYFQFGISMKSSAMRLADSFLLISKTDTEVSIGIISKNLQSKIDTDLILTLIVNYKIVLKDSNIEYIAKSNFPNECISLILEELSFLFKTNKELFNYFNSFHTGTHIYLYDLNQLSAEKKNIGQLANYELFFDLDKGDILYNLFFTEFGDSKFIDASLIQYLNFCQIEHSQSTAIHLFGYKLLLANPLLNITQITKVSNDAIMKIASLKINDDDPMTNCLWIDGESYRGVLFNRKYINDLIQNLNFDVDNLKDNDFYNGVLIYKNNQLVSRMNQNKLGDISFFIRKFSNKSNIDSSNLFKINGYIELPNRGYDLTFSKNEIKDQSVSGFLFMKMKGLLQHINKN